jgi:hypothetical protein
MTAKPSSWMQHLWLRITAAATLALTTACTPPARVGEQRSERLSGCLHRIYADGPPGSGEGGVLYTLSTDAGATRVLDVRPEQLRRSGGASTLEGARVSVVLPSSRDSSSSHARPARVLEIRREPSRSGVSC